MRFLIDECVSPIVADVMRDVGHDAQHVRSLQLNGAEDHLLIAKAVADQSVMITSDHDFGKIMFRRSYEYPSIIFLREDVPGPARELAKLILANLDPLAEPLESGAIVTIHGQRLRVRRLPIQP